MHWFKRNIGDYHKKAGRLTMLQHGAYTLLMDSCYDREQFPTLEDAISWVWASSKEEIEAVEFVLNRFFTLKDGVYTQKRIAEDVKDYQSKSEKNKRIAIDREAKRRENSTNQHESCTSSEQVVNETPPNQEPITKNHKPETKDKLDFSPLAFSIEEIKEFKDIRARKRGAVSQRVINEHAKQFELSRQRGYTNDDILNEWSTRGWTAYKDAWMKVELSKEVTREPIVESHYDPIEELNRL